MWWLILYWVLTYFKKLFRGTFVKLNISLHSWRRYTSRIWSYHISLPLFSLPTHLCGYGQRLCDLRDFARNSWKACLARTDKRMMWCQKDDIAVQEKIEFHLQPFLRTGHFYALDQLFNFSNWGLANRTVANHSHNNCSKWSDLLKTVPNATLLYSTSIQHIHKPSYSVIMIFIEHQ